MDKEKKPKIKRDSGNFSYVSLLMPKELKAKLDDYVLQNNMTLTRFYIEAAERVLNDEQTQTREQYEALKTSVDILNAKVDLILKDMNQVLSSQG